MAELDADKTLSERLANQALSNLKKQFDTRMANEDKVAAKKSDILKQIESFQNEGFLTRGKLNYEYGTDVEDRLRTLFKVRQNIFDMFGGSMPYDLGKGETAEGNLKLAMGQWLSFGTQNRAEFYKWLKDKGWSSKKDSSEPTEGYWMLIGTNIDEANSALVEKFANEDEWGVAHSYEIHPGGGSMSTTRRDGDHNYTIKGLFTFNAPDKIKCGEKFEIKCSVSDAGSDNPNAEIIHNVGAQVCVKYGENWSVIGKTGVYVDFCLQNNPTKSATQAEAVEEFTAPGKVAGFSIHFDIKAGNAPGSLYMNYDYVYVDGNSAE